MCPAVPDRFQCFFWHSAEQYLASLHLEHVRKISPSSAVPHSRQTWVGGGGGGCCCMALALGGLPAIILDYCVEWVSSRVNVE